MARKTRRALRGQGFKLDPLSVVSFRIQPEVWERCAWAAAAKGINRTEFVRATLADATRDAKSPKPPVFRASPAERELWESAARLRGQGVHEYLLEVANKFSRHVLATAPPKSPTP